MFIIPTERRGQQCTNYQWSSPLVTYRQRCLRRSTRGSDEHAIAREGHTVTHYDMLGRTRTLRRTKRHYNTLRHVRTHWDLHGHWTHYGSGTLRACKMGIRRIRRRVPRSTEHGRSRKLDLCPAPLGPVQPTNQTEVIVLTIGTLFPPNPNCVDSQARCRVTRRGCFQIPKFEEQDTGFPIPSRTLASQSRLNTFPL